MRTILAAMAVVALTVPAIAQSIGDFESVDADQDGSVSLREGRVVIPDLSEADFTAADTDGSGQLNQQEFEALVAKLGL
ncbi:EF hand [Devosia enhydra]|uniref:EF hand n=1 Tax=Devosia enhydra TaxID=665118 RepID=A0A1K2HUP2_9HYPH|nr:hypothetical protein [Devosia enhydra]SFZ82256.1 EF hand [Devosia enhydra]